MSSEARSAPAERLIFVCQSYSPAVDGTAVLIRNLAERFAADGDEVHVLTTDAIEPAGFRTRRRARADAPPVEELRGVHVHRLRTHWWLSAACRPAQAAGRRLRVPGAERLGDIYLGPVIRGLERALDQLAPTAVYASAFPYWHMHQLVAWGRRRRVPVVLHGAMHPDDRWAFDRASIRRACRRAAGYAANTAYEARYVEGLGVSRDRVTVVGAGIDLAAFAEPGVDRPLNGSDGARPRILYLGSLMASKGLDTVVGALPEIWSQLPDVGVVIAGKTTAETQALHRAALDCSQGRDLRWLADITEAEKRELLASATLVLYPSRAESFGIVFLEAWANGRPVIGCRAGAVPDVVEDGVSGILIAPGDCRALADSVALLIQDPAAARRMGAEGQRRVREQHTWAAVAGRARQALRAASEAASVRELAPDPGQRARRK
jgi:glycosyltransferase involved in cell wall biosynthesis